MEREEWRLRQIPCVRVCFEKRRMKNQKKRKEAKEKEVWRRNDFQRIEDGNRSWSGCGFQHRYLLSHGFLLLGLTSVDRFHWPTQQRSLYCRAEATKKIDRKGNRTKGRTRSSWIILGIYLSSTFSLSQLYTKDRDGNGRIEVDVVLKERRTHSGLEGVTFLPFHTWGHLALDYRVFTTWYRFSDSRKHGRILFVLVALLPRTEIERKPEP